MPVIVALQLRTPRTERPFRTGFCANSVFPGAAVIRNDAAAPRRRFWNSRRLVSIILCPERTKEDTEEEARILLVPFRAFPRDSGTLRNFVVTIRIFVACFLRKCSVLHTLTPAVGFVSA